MLISLAVQAAPEGTFWCGGMIIMPRTLPLYTDSSAHADVRKSQT
jgi:hypothetical protein